MAVQGVKLNSGQIVDARFVEGPRERNTGGVPDDQERGDTRGLDEERCKAAAENIDGRWTKKYDADHYGNKTHISVDRRAKLVIKERATAANVHDGQIFDELLGATKTRGSDVADDSAYRRAEQEQCWKRQGFRSHARERACRGRLTEVTQRKNRR